jgi:diguanylate cyclase (GGDEF)-like protein
VTPPIIAANSSSHRPHQPAPPAAEWDARLLDEVPAGLAIFDRDLRYVAANAQWISSFGLAALSLGGRRHQDVDPAASAEFAALQHQALAGSVIDGCATTVADATGRVCHRGISMRPQRGGAGEIVGVIAVLHEIVATPPDGNVHDQPDRLTGAAGRRRFFARLRAALAQGASAQGGTAMFLLDIDNFRGINDLHGTGVGDQVLQTIATRILAGIRSRRVPAGRGVRRIPAGEADLVARLGADEFGIILGSAAPSIADAEAFSRRLLQLVATPIVVGERRIRLTANVGFMVTNATHRTEDDAMRDLNVALQEAKTRGPNSAKAWEPLLTSSLNRRLVLLDELRRALDEGEFVLHYQPILNLASERVVGAEALLRWNHPRDGLIHPQQFLPLLEETGLIVPVGCWVIREVVRQVQVWHMLYGRDMLEWISVNVSARQFNDPSLLLATLCEVSENGFSLDRLKLEITESAVMRNREVTRTVLGQLQDLGIGIALDDFGTGYSALGVLRHYSVDMIKIDRDFTARLETDDGRELILALLKIARIFDAAVVIEGIETAAQRDVLRAARCEYAQGHLFAKPMDGSFFGAFALTHLVGGG